MSRLTDYMNGITDTYEPEGDEQADSVGGSVETAATSGVKYPVYSTDMSDEPLYEIPWDDWEEGKSSTTDSYSFGDIVESSLREHNSFYRYHVAREEGRLDDSLVTMPGIETSAAGFPFHADTVYSPDPSFNLSQALDENKVEEENRHRFSRVVNEWQFNNVINNLEQEKSDRAVLNDTGFFNGLTPQIITGVLEPSNYGVMLLGTGLKLGSVAVRGAIEGALMGGLNASVRGTLNDEFSLREAAYESVATGITAGIFAGAIKGSISIVKSPEFKAIARDMKNAITPDFKEWFRVESGELTHVSSGRFGEFKHKAKRAVWEFFNNSPNYQMHNSGNNELRELAPLIFRGRNGNFSEVGELIPVAAEENVRLAASEENLMMQRVDKHRVKYREEGGNLEQFNKEVVDSTINTYVDLNSGELYFGRLPQDPVQTELFAEPPKAAKVKNINKYLPEELHEIQAGVDEDIAVITRDFENAESEISDFFRTLKEMEILENERKFETGVTESYEKLDRKKYETESNRDRKITELVKKKDVLENIIGDRLQKRIHKILSYKKPSIPKNEKIDNEIIKFDTSMNNVRERHIEAENKQADRFDTYMSNLDERQSDLVMKITERYKVGLKNVVDKIGERHNVASDKLERYFNKAIRGVESRLPKGQREFRFYDQEFAEMMGLSKEFEDARISDNPHVLAAAKERIDFWRKIIQKAKKMGTLDEAFGEGGINTERNAVTSEIANMSAEDFVKGVQTETLPQTKLVSLGHVMRRYSPEKVHANRGVLAPLLAREIHMDSPKLTPEEVKSVTNRILAKLVNKNVKVRNEAFNDLPAGVKFTKQREVAITDSLLSAADILDYDTIVYELGSWRELAASTELNRVAKNMGYDTWGTLKETFKDLSDESTGASVGNKLKTDAVSEVHNYNYALLHDVEKLLKGTFGKEDFLNGNRVWKWFSNSSGLAFMAQSGMLPLSMLTDGSAIILRAGFGKSLKRLIAGIPNTMATRLSIPLEAVGKKYELPTLSNMGKWLKEMRTNDPELFQRTFGFIEKQIEETRFISDLGAYAKDTKMRRSTNWCTKYSGLDALNRSLRNVAGQEIYDKLLTECLKSEPNLNYLSKMGITREQKTIIAEAYRKYGYKNGMTKFLDPEDIGNTDISNQIRVAVESLLDQTILIPGIGNVPRFLRTGWGRMIYMFTTYPYMIFNDVLRPAFGGLMPETHMFAAIGTSYALSITRKLMADASNGKESDPTSWEFWSEVQQYSMTDFYALDIIRRGLDALVGKYGREATDQISPILSFWNGMCDFAGLRKTGRAVRNTIPGVNFWWARPLTNPLLPDINKRGKYTR